MRPVLIMAGGTGGHIFPGIAVARVLRERGVPVHWLGSAGGLENRLVAEAGIPISTVAISGLRGKGGLAMLLAPFLLLRAVWQALRVLRRLRPRSVLSMGGFAAAPGGLAAWLLRLPLLVHEQNRVPGLTNRALAMLARRVLQGFPGAFAGAEVATVGNPVRQAIVDLPPPDERYPQRDGALRLLVLGGSQGARSLNRALPQALARQQHAIVVRHQCGTRMLDDARAAYAAANVEATVEAFIDDMAAAYGWADLVVCRAGALTLAELAAAGVAAILVPYPFAVDDHQTRNAEFLVECGAARMIAESPALADDLATALQALDSRARLLGMAQAARAQAMAGAAERVADICMAEVHA